MDVSTRHIVTNHSLFSDDMHYTTQPQISPEYAPQDSKLRDFQLIETFFAYMATVYFIMRK